MITESESDFFDDGDVSLNLQTAFTSKAKRKKAKKNGLFGKRGKRQFMTVLTLNSKVTQNYQR